jgi:hypothetical protein
MCFALGCITFLGLAIHNFLLKTGEDDCVLFVDRRAMGVLVSQF